MLFRSCVSKEAFSSAFLLRRKLVGMPESPAGQKGSRIFVRASLESHFLLHSPRWANSKFEIRFKSHYILGLEKVLQQGGQLILLIPKGRRLPVGNFNF